MTKCAIKTCRKVFQRRSITHKCCSPECAQQYAQESREAAERKRDREKRKALKSRSDWMREAQAAFNRYIRTRDHDDPCISCGRHHTGQYHAGHYRSVGSCPELRFNELNVHKQCQPCNTHLHGNLILYRLRLIDKIGLEAVELLEGYHPPVKYSSSDLESIKAHYNQKSAWLISGRKG